ncbi:unnamed protein product [Hymenolepis diminuta]|uniref:Uncharacterized protein n=1 Tax=Hymenolepis diminuta TaxID=6216 RepID=A0A564YTZ3_HYMDI|nr:unnamed protein product [Hymenolepis diminuta]
MPVGQEEGESEECFCCYHTSLCSLLSTGSPVDSCDYHKMHGSLIYDVEVAGYGFVKYSSNKNETFSFQSVLEDLWVIFLRMEMLEETIIISSHSQHFFYE